MPVQGLMWIAGNAQPGEGASFSAVEAATGAPLSPAFQTASPPQVEAALTAAHRAAPTFAASAPSARANLLEAMGAAILAIGDDLIERALAESGLPRPRLEGERMRTVTQLRLFATLLREGDFASVRIDSADLARAAGPKPDLRLAKRALGPVAVFGASNFPLAFSVAGGDTASALAAGCPVVVKGHPAHPGTSELVASALSSAVAACGFDPGTFSLLQDGGIGVGQALASDARIKAIGFTGSRRAGEALVKLAAARAEPIPVYAEMSATNPVLMMPARLEEAAEQIGAAFVGSLTLGTGQFCTNPGLVIALKGAACDRFLAAAGEAVKAWAPGVMLTPGICDAFAHTAGGVAAQAGVTVLAESAAQNLRATARLMTTDAATYMGNPALHQEMFGPAALVVQCATLDEMLAVLSAVEGQLTVAIHFNADDHDVVRRVLPLAMGKAGRVLANGFGTGVEVSPAMVHGGPSPATSDSRTTSVGTLAIDRFLRPVCLQDFPEDLRPEAVQDANPWALPRRIW
ncbi:MAG TPA: aldehyde dehydrogenase (NADP(+)) [Chakrabartia sp.]|nr:aldehyde dehydrogenase (NADP(+)) [Chakrabartia sp.]